jgi:hypothetical protein
MNTQLFEPMVTNQVHTTKDYFLFKPIEGNRNKNLLHINRLKKSMQESYLFTVIIVNENYEIIDGQHRFDVVKELNLPLNYIICRGYGLREVQILNATSKTWNADDYLEGYCKLGYKDYLIYREFKNKYKFNHNECMNILQSGSLANSDGPTIKKFYMGNFKVKCLAEAERVSDLILLIEPYYKNFRRRCFVQAMTSLIKNVNFNFTEFIQKLKIQPTSLVDCHSASSYITLIEEIYNYKRREKVNLRY